MEAISDLKAISQICAAAVGDYFEAQLEAEAKFSQPWRDSRRMVDLRTEKGRYVARILAIKAFQLVN